MQAAFFALILAARLFCASLAPLTPARAELADAIARVVYEDAPFYRDDAAKLRTLALHVAVAYRESSLTADAIGDGGHSYCAFQIHDSSGGRAELAHDLDACVRAGHAMLRASVRLCREHPVAWYARGPRGCTGQEGQRISADRVAVANSLVRDLLIHPHR